MMARPRIVFDTNVLVSAALFQHSVPRQTFDKAIGAGQIAVSGKAKYLVTGDDDLLSLHPFREILILTPAAFLQQF